MAVSPARAAAFEILLKVGRENAYASELLHSTRYEDLSSLDHGLTTELVMGVLRWQSRLDANIARVSSQKLDRLDDEVLGALRLGAYQLQFLTRIPARAAIFEGVEMVKAARKRSAASFVNAVLRNLAGNPKGAPAGSEHVFAEISNSSDAIELAGNSAHPEWLVERWVKQYGIAEARAICASNQRTPSTATHIHEREVPQDLAEAGIQLAPGHLLSAARTVLAGDVTKTHSCAEGRVSIQDEASQLVALLVGQGDRILDCCSAPGGKTTLIAERNRRSMVVASDLHPHRVRLLRSLTRRANVRVVAADARHLPFSVTFDRILADVPCSGTGTLSRNPEIKWRLTIPDLGDLQRRQIAILKSALAQLSPGGRLVYSTCSLECEENEAVVESALASTVEFSRVDCRGELERLSQAGELSSEFGPAVIQGIVSGPYLRTIPGVHPCDGFFAAIIQKNQG